MFLYYFLWSSSLNKVIKIAYGEYAIHPQKGENLANFTATNSESEAFKLQPSPNQDDKLEDLIWR